MYLICASLISVCFGMFLLDFILYGVLWTSTWANISFPILGKFLLQSLQIFSWHLFTLPSPGTPMMQMLVQLMFSQRSLRLSSIHFILFSLFLCVAVISTTLSSTSLIHSSTSDILLLIPSSEFFISDIVLFIFISSFFKSSRC